MSNIFILSESGTVFSTRFKGSIIGKLIGDYLEKRSSMGNFEVDFRDVEAVSFSFTDELIKVLSGRADVQSIEFVNASDNVTRVLKQIMIRRKQNIRIDESNHLNRLSALAN